MAVTLPASGARVDFAMFSGMPCFQAGGGGVCADRVAAIKDRPSAADSAPMRCRLGFTFVSSVVCICCARNRPGGDPEAFIVGFSAGARVMPC